MKNSLIHRIIYICLALPCAFSFLVNRNIWRPSFQNKLLTGQLQMSAATGSMNSVTATSASTAGVIPEGGVSPCVIKVVGVGGAGGNAVLRMIQTGVDGVDFAAINTDAQALARFKNIASTLNIGKDVTRGLGAGGIPDNGRKAAEESRGEILSLVQGCDLVFITAGMGGGTGSGAAPVVAEIAREAGALTVGVVTKPFGFEGRRRMQQALKAIENLRAVVDTLIIVSNDRLLQIIPDNTPLEKAFTVADDVLRQGVVGISEIIIRPGLINVDFADVRTIMGNAGTALMGIGRGSGKARAEEAARAAISSPLLDFPIERARGVVFNIVGGDDLTLQEINTAAEVIYEAVDPNANIIFGSLVDPSMTGEIAITVIATGFPISLTDDSSTGSGNSPTAVNAGAAVKKAAQQVENQAQLLTTQLSNRRKSVNFADELAQSFGNTASSSANTWSQQQQTGILADDDIPEFISRLRKKK